MNNDMTINELAQTTREEFISVRADIDHGFAAVAKQFAVVDERLDKLEAGQARLEQGLQKVLDVVLEIPSKKAIEKLTHKVEDIDQRVVVLEQKAA